MGRRNIQREYMNRVGIANKGDPQSNKPGASMWPVSVIYLL